VAEVLNPESWVCGLSAQGPASTHQEFGVEGEGALKGQGGEAKAKAKRDVTKALEHFVANKETWKSNRTRGAALRIRPVHVPRVHGTTRYQESRCFGERDALRGSFPHHRQEAARAQRSEIRVLGSRIGRSPPRRPRALFPARSSTRRGELE